MNFHCLLVAMATVGCVTPFARGTIVGTGLAYQPVYLGNAFQSDRIPLAPVICNANHGFCTWEDIFQSRPSYHGYFKGAARPEYEQNLAVIFGISCKLRDYINLAGCTATFGVRKVSPPSNAPYTQERELPIDSLETLLR